MTPWTTARQASLSFTVSQGWLRLMSTESVIPSNHLIFCHPLILLAPIFHSIRVFSNESALRIRWPKDWSFSFSFSISPSNEYSGLISFRIDWFDLLAVQGTLGGEITKYQASKWLTFWFQWVWGPHAYEERTVNFFHLVGVLVSEKQLKGTAQNIIYSPWGGSKGPWLRFMAKLVLFCLTCLFSFVSSFFDFSD